MDRQQRLQHTNPGFLEAARLAGPIIVCVGGILLLLYLSSVRFGLQLSFDIFLVAVGLCSSGICLSFISMKYLRAEVSSILSLYVLSLVLLLIFSMRYDGFHGMDVIGEYKIASITCETSRWPIDLQYYGSMDRPGRYASCISVTILPSILSKVTGLDILAIFKYFLPFIGASIPILTYLLLKSVFKSKELAFLTAIFLATSHNFIFVLSYLFREQFGLFFLLLSFISLVNFRKRHFAISPLLLAGVVMSDYVFSLLAFLILAVFASTQFLKGIRNKIFKPRSDRSADRFDGKHWITAFLYFAAIMLFWVRFVAVPIFSDIVDRIQTFVSLTVQYGSGFLIKLITLSWRPPFSPSTQGFGGSSIDIIWYYSTAGLMILGLLYSFLKARKQALNSIKTGWFIICLILLCSFFLGYFYYFPSEPNRVYLVSIVFLSYLATLPLWALIGINPRHRKLKKISKCSLVMVSIFLFFSLPIGLNLQTNQTILHYHSETDIMPRIKATYLDTGIRDFVFSQYIEGRISSDKYISVDLRGFLDVYLANHLNKTFVFSANFAFSTNYLTVSRYYLEYGMWVGRWEINNATQLDLQKISEHSVIYNDGTGMLLYRS